MEVTTDEGGQGGVEEAEPCPFLMEYDHWMSHLCPHLKGITDTMMITQKVRTLLGSQDIMAGPHKLFKVEVRIEGQGWG